jgi:hypothetical protein
MTELDQLAQMSQQHQVHRPPTRKPAKRSNWTVLIVVLAVAGAGLLLIGGLVLKNRTPARRFEANLQSNGGVRWIAVTNQGDSPLTISGVNVNGEFVCPIGKTAGGVTTRDDEKNYQVTIPASGSGSFLVASVAEIGKRDKNDSIFQEGPARDSRSYTKEPVYVDFKTDRGNFRYRVGKGWEDVK